MPDWEHPDGAVYARGYVSGSKDGYRIALDQAAEHIKALMLRVPGGVGVRMVPLLDVLAVLDEMKGEQ